MSVASGHALGTGPCRYGRLAVYLMLCALVREGCVGRVSTNSVVREPFPNPFLSEGKFLANASRVRRFSWIAPSFPCFFYTPRMTHPDCQVQLS